MRVLVCGGRKFSDSALLKNTLDRLGITELAEGDAPGADRMAGKWAEFSGIQLRKFPANWKKFRNAAGPIRNREMFNEFKPELVVAFPGGNGTADMISIARKNGCKVLIVESH